MRSLLALLPVLMACSAGPPAEFVSVADSAGVQITTAAAPRWQGDEGWRVASAPVVDIGRDQADSTQLLSIVMAVQLLADGRVVVQDNGTSRLLVFDSSGRRVNAIGRQGQGPGEFTGMWGTYRCGGDTLVVNQGRMIGVFGPDGAFAARQMIDRPPGTYPGGINGVSGDCGAILLDGRKPVEPRSGIFQSEARLWWWSRQTARWDTVVRFLGMDHSRIVVAGRPAAAPLPFGRTPVWAVSGDRVYFGPSDRPEIHVYHPTGRLERLIRWDQPVSDVTDADRTAYEKRRQGYLERHPEEAIVYLPLADYPVPRRKPVYSNLLLDDAGRLWALQYPFAAAGLPHVDLDEATPEREQWWVFGADDVWYGTVTMPPGFSLRAIAADRLAGISIDSSAAERVQVYRLLRPE